MTNWGYGQCCGPENWEKEFPAASGNHQSPINIITKDTQFDSELSKHKLKFTIDTAHKHSQTLRFTGHNFKVDISENNMAITGVPGHKNDQFKIVQFHFHWSDKEDEIGSEHQVNGRGYPAELHLVHYNSTKYASICEACESTDGLAVLGVFFEIGKENHDLQHLMKHLEDIQTTKCVDLHSEDLSLDLKNLLPENTDRYFTYPGSLTTPPCKECVTWIVFEHTLSMSKEQLDQFRRVHDDECHTHENFRPINPLNNRKVKRSFK